MRKNLLSAAAMACIISILLFTVSSFAAVSYDRTGKPNTYVNTGNYASDLVNVALTQVGYKENPDAADYTKYSNWYFGKDNSYAWCGIFVSWCADQAGIPTTIVYKNKHVYGATADTYDSLTEAGDYFGGTSYAIGSKDPAPGDIFFSTTESAFPDSSTHSGIVWKVDSNYIYTIEGNTHFKNSSGQLVGQVATRMYNRKSGYQYYSSSKTTSSYVHILFFVHPDYEGTAPESVEETEIPDTSSTVTSIFNDVSPDAYYADAVQWAVEHEITSGTTNTTFSPDQECTRGQVAAFLYRFSKSKMQIESSTYTDVSKDDYYYYPVNWCAWAGITNGTTATTFSPSQAVTRAQFLTMLYRYAGCPISTYTGKFTDVPNNKYYSNAVYWAVQKGITYGTTTTTFSPEVSCSRAQVVSFLYRYAQYEGIS